MFITTYEKTELIRILTNKITQLDHKQRTATEQPLKTRFAPHLFSENNQVFSFYFQELKQTLTQLENAPETDIALCAFLQKNYYHSMLLYLKP